jgi:predicted permease
MKKLLRRLTYWIRHRQEQDSLTEELEFHREMKQEHLESEGMPAAEADEHSRRALGNTLASIENSREVWTWAWLDQFVRDTRIGARSLLRTPAFVVFSTLILSIGIGSMVTVFAFVNSIFFKSLDIPDPAALVRIYGGEGGLATAGGRMRYTSYVEYRDRNRTLAQMGLFMPGGPLPLRLHGPRTLPIDVVQPTVVSNGLFKAIGAHMALGRALEATDEKTGSPNVVILNETAWKRYFGNDAGILDKTVYLNNTPYTIVGISPTAFEDALSFLPVFPRPQLFIPVRDDAPLRGRVDILGRFASGLSRTAVQADFNRIASQLSVEQQIGAVASVDRPNSPPSGSWAGMASLAVLFLVIVLSVLLIACDDIAIMLFARIAARRREMGIRVALGGGRLQLIRQLVSENVLLSILGGTGAMIFILLAARSIERLGIPLPETSRMIFEWRVLAFTILTSLATTLFFGLRPALQCVNRDVVESMTPGSRSAGRRQGRVRSNLVVGQIAFCTALLITAAVVVRAVQPNTFADPGFKTDGLSRADINFVGTAYTRDSQIAFYHQLLQRLAASPGVKSASIMNNSSIDGANESVKTAANVGLASVKTVIDEAYFRTLQAPLIAGRSFNERDDANSTPVGIINQKLALMFPRTESPIGQTIRTSDGTLVQIVGVARNIDYRNGVRYAKPVLYRPLQQIQTTTSDTLTVLVRFSGTGGALRAIHDKVAELDPSLLVYNFQTLETQLERLLLPVRLVGYVIAIPGVFALLLGVVGTYGTIATLVAQRRREIGIRVALGAHPSWAVRNVFVEGVKSVSIGVGFGTAAVVIILLWLSRHIGDVDLYDPVAFAVMILLVTATAGAACYLPARHASRVDPMVVLRED